MSQYKINESIIIRYLASSLEEGLTDLTLTPTNPNGADETPIVLSEIGDGLYETTFTPDVLGWWWVRISSASKPLNVFSKNYFVGESDEYGAIVEDYYPSNLSILNRGDNAPLRVDEAGSLITRSAVLTDEGSFYEPFSGIVLGDGWIPITGSGASISVANSRCSIVSGNTNNASTYISKLIDYCPITITSIFSISQRILNQDLYFGLSSSATPNAAQRVRFHFFGTDNTKVALESQSSFDTGGDEGANIQVLLPYGMNTSENLTYRIVHNGKQVEFYVGRNTDNLVLMGVHNNNIPDLYISLYARFRVTNGTSVASSTDFLIHSAQINNYNIISIEGTVEGNVNVKQKVTISGSNNSTSNLNSGASFTGIGESTLGVNSIQINFIADQNCTVQLEQSINNVNWDIIDNWTCLANIGQGRTFQAIASYFRVIVTNNGGSTTTYLRLQSSLCPIVECLPRTLSQSGNLKVELAPRTASIMLNLIYDVINSTPINANEWQDSVVYTIPSGYDFSPSLFFSTSTQALDEARVVSALTFGNYNSATNTFTDSTSVVLPDFYAKMYVYVTTLIGAVGDDVITITYTNQAGTIGKTATVTIKKNSVVGTRLEVTLAAGDFGIIDITNVTHTRTGQAGAFDIYVNKEINYLLLTTANIEYEQKADSGTIFIPPATSIKLQYRSTNAGAKSRLLSLSGVLNPRG